MPKIGYTPRARYRPGPIADADGNFAGGNVAPGSMGTDAFGRGSRRELSQLAPSLGFITHGTAAFGTLGKGRVIIGDLVDGLAVRDTSERTSLAITTGGRLRIGYADTPGIDMVAGLVDMHGGATRAGTITADKLDVGELAADFMRSDAILVGDGNPLDPETVTGVLITTDFFGGRRNGEVVFEFDKQTGHFLSLVPSDTTGRTFLDIGAGSVVFSNKYADLPDFFAAADALPAQRSIGVHMTTWTQSPITGEWGSIDLNLLGINETLYVINTTKSAAPALALADSSGLVNVEISQAGIRMKDGAVGLTIGRTLTGIDLDFMQNTPNTPLRMGGADLAVLELAPNRASIVNGWLTFDAVVTEGGGYVWPRIEEFPEWRVGIYPHPDTREPLWWDGVSLRQFALKAIE